MIPTDPRERLTEEIARIQRWADAGDAITAVTARREIALLERARAIAFDGASLSPEPVGCDLDEPQLGGYAERADG